MLPSTCMNNEGVDGYGNLLDKQTKHTIPSSGPCQFLGIIFEEIIASLNIIAFPELGNSWHVFSFQQELFHHIPSVS